MKLITTLILTLIILTAACTELKATRSEIIDKQRRQAYSELIPPHAIMLCSESGQCARATTPARLKHHPARYRFVLAGCTGHIKVYVSAEEFRRYSVGDAYEHLTLTYPCKKRRPINNEPNRPNRPINNEQTNIHPHGALLLRPQSG